MISSTKRWACFISAALLVLISANLQAQHEVGVKLHTVNFMGDFGGGGYDYAYTYNYDGDDYDYDYDYERAGCCCWCWWC